MTKRHHSESRAQQPIRRTLLRSTYSILGATALLVLLAGCTPRDAATGNVAAESVGDPRVAAIIEGRSITIGDIDEHLKDQFLEEFLQQPEERIFEMRENAVRDLVQKHIVDAEAARLGKTEDEIYASIAESVTAPTEAEISAWYTANESRVRGAKFEDVAPAIAELLVKERRAQAMSNFFGPKLEALSWKMVISPARKELETTRLVRGSADAPITIMAFSDYQCPYCVRAEPVLAQVLARYPEDVKVVHRHFPLDSIHPFARPAAEAAMCADEQGKFWEYHDGIFARAGQLADGSLAEIASSVDLDAEAFEACVDERRYQTFVQGDFEAGRAAGVTGTPSFFLNGIPLKGARDADELSRYVEQELARLRAS